MLSSRRRAAATLPLVAVFAGLISSASCSSDADLPPAEAGPAGTAGKAGDASLEGASGGNSGTSTDARNDSPANADAGDAEDPYLCDAKPPQDPGGTALSGESCCTGLGTCVSAAALDRRQRVSFGFDACAPNAGLLCAPNADYTADGGRVADAGPPPATCRSVLNVEGRCIRRCFTLGNATAGSLQQKTCADGEVCGPCYDPVDGSDSGYCWSPGDAPTEPPTKAVSCANGQGRCFLATDIPPDFPSLLQVDCPTADLVCVPLVRAADANYCFPHCTTGDPLPALAGACVPDWIVTPAQASLIQQMSCDAGFLCAPCIYAGVRTGACN